METTEFQIGDVVRCNESNTVLVAGQEYTVIGMTTWGLAFCDKYMHTPTPGRFTLVRRASASPAQEAWVPKVGDRVRAVKVNTREKPGEYEAKLGDEFVVQSIERDYQEPAAFGDGIWADLCNLEPAPMPSGSAGKEADVYCGDCREPASTCRHSKPDPYAVAKSVSDAEHAAWQSRNEQARKRNIAALAREIDDGPGRRARLHPSEGRSDRVYGSRRWE